MNLRPLAAAALALVMAVGGGMYVGVFADHRRSRRAVAVAGDSGFAVAG